MDCKNYKGEIMDILGILKEHSSFDGAKIVVDISGMKEKLMKELLKPAFIAFKAKVDSRD
jgi:hypothetical protein